MLAEALEQEAVGCAMQPQLLAMIDAGCRATESERSARAHFDEDEGIAIAHDQVEFADLVAHVGRNMHEACRFQQAPRGLLGVAARRRPIRAGQVRRRGTPP
jgi:hypothetical protein